MPSNERPAFDVLSAHGDALERMYLPRASYRVADALEQVRHDTVEAVRARQTERGEVAEAEIRRVWDNDDNRDEWEMPFEGLTSDQAQTVCQFARRIFALRESQAPEAARDTDFARARVEGARDVLERCAKAMAETCAGSRSVSDCDYWVGVAGHIRDYMADEYPAPKPAECRKFVTVVNDCGDPVEVFVDPDSPHGAKWRGHLTLARGTKTVLAASRTTLADLIQTMDLAVSDAQMADLLALDKAFAATLAEGTDGR